MALVNWTTEQSAAIHARGGSLLVSAGAGSGKTAVLTERVLALLTDENNPADIEDLLIVTYTRAAAGEMRARIAKKLEEHLKENPQKHYLKMQILKMGTAKISTVHSFCKDIITENYEKLGVAIDFRMVDEEELAVWREDAAAMVTERYYEQEDEQFYQLVELLSDGRDDKQLVKTIISLYDYLRSYPFYEKWAEQKLAMYKNAESAAESPWGQIILRHCAGQAAFVLQKLVAVLPDLESDEKITKAYGSAIYTYINFCEELEALAKLGEWDTLYNHIKSFSAPDFGRLVGFGDDPRKAAITAARGSAKDLLDDLKAYFCCSEADFLDDMAYTAPKLELLFKIVLEFGEELDITKRRRNALHFSDLEHLALGLLCTPAENGYIPSEIAKKTAAKLGHIFIDEYQDSNDVQELIFSMVSKNGENLFMVGDVKQSIYSFRQAKPEIFLQKKNTFNPFESGLFPAQINLNKNFRSTPGIISAVNFFFELLMSAEIGEIDYKKGEQLLAGQPEEELQEPPCVLSVIELAGYEGELKASELEAEFVAQKISTLLESDFKVKDSGRERLVTAGDICILMRSPGAKAAIYENALKKHGINCAVNTGGNFLDLPEVSPLISFLKALDNPLLDIELTAALVSPLFSFDADMLAQIKLASPKYSGIFTGLTVLANQGDKQCARFAALFAKFRVLAATAPADELLVAVLDETAYEAKILTRKQGKQKLQNVRLLVEYAAAHAAREQSGNTGFVQFISRLQETGNDLAAAALRPSQGNVALLSIHKSKGLEYPVVFLVDTAKAFNKEDLRKPLLTHTELGFAVRRRNFEEMTEYTTLPLMAVKLDADRKLKSEEMRALYVALTRPKQKLFIVGSVKNFENKIAAQYSPLDENGKLPPLLTEQAGSYLDWLLAAVLHSGAAEEYAQANTVNRLCPHVAFERLNPDDFMAEKPEQEEENLPVTHAKADDELVRLLKKRFAAEYKFETATKVPTKFAVSDIVKAAAQNEESAERIFSARPRFTLEKGLTGAEIGNAHHIFMQFCSYKAAAENPQAEIARLKADEFITPQQAEVIDPAVIAKFFASPLGRRIFASGDVRREFRFLAEVNEDILGDYLDFPLGGNNVTVQGVADCLFFETDGIVLVDYKTNRTTAQYLRETYGVQLAVYKALLERIFEVPVKQCIIYSFYLGEEIVL